MPNKTKESSPFYRYAVSNFSSRYRLIECKDNHQWIVQRYSGNRWRSGQYFRTKAALFRCLSQLGLSVETLGNLPDNFRSQFKAGQEADLLLSSGLPLRKQKAESDHALSASKEVFDA